MTTPRGRARPAAVTVVLVAVAIAGWSLLSRPRPAPPHPQASADGGAGREGALPPGPGPLPSLRPGDGAAPGDGPAPDATGVALDCSRPSGNAAMVDDSPLTVERLCTRLSRIGGVGASGVDHAQARVVFNQLVDAVLVHRALAFERAAVTEAELSEALAALRPDAGPPADAGRLDLRPPRPDAGRPGAVEAEAVLREQVLERLELRKLASLRRPVAEVTESEVDAELARGAPGIDRGQGVRVEAWVARVPPGTDAGVQSPAQRAAEAFAQAVQSGPPETAAAQHRMAHLAPFVVAPNGVEPELEQAASGLQPGQWSGAVRTRVGWVVLRALGREEGQPLTDVAFRQRVRQALESRRQQAARQETLAALRAAARVQLLVDL